MADFADYSVCTGQLGFVDSSILGMTAKPAEENQMSRNRTSSLSGLLVWAGTAIPMMMCGMPLTGCSSFAGGDFNTAHNEVALLPPGGPVVGMEPIVDELGNVISEGEVPQQLPPAELAKVSLPLYRLEPPDVLLLQAVRMAPKAPYKINVFDVLQIVVPNSLPDQPIANFYQVEPSGTVNLGAAYGSVEVAGKTLDEATDAISRRLQRVLSGLPQVSVQLSQLSGQQQIGGEHLIAPDGTVNLGIYGSVYVAGLTIPEARHAIESHLSQFLEEPSISVDVFAYNSKVFYIIYEGAGLGEQVVRLPVTGNETVLDAIASVGGLQQVSSKRIWIARPAPQGVGCDQLLPVDWKAITRGGSTATNFQILPGDRIFIAEDRLLAMQTIISKTVSPIQQLMGFVLTGSQMVQSLQLFPRSQSTIFGF